MRAFLTAVALATLMAAPALAQTRESPAANPYSPYAAQSSGQHGAQDRDAVVTGNKVIGHDPDPFIRNENLRHYDSAWPD
jgi:hypothetical protein